MGRKEVRVPLADEGPIRETEIGELRIAECGADALHVPSSAPRIHEPQQVTASMTAADGEFLIGPVKSCGFLLVVEHRVEREKRVELRGVEAGDGGAVGQDTSDLIDYVEAT